MKTKLYVPFAVYDYLINNNNNKSYQLMKSILKNSSYNYNTYSVDVFYENLIYLEDNLDKFELSPNDSLYKGWYKVKIKSPFGIPILNFEYPSYKRISFEDVYIYPNYHSDKDEAKHGLKIREFEDFKDLKENAYHPTITDYINHLKMNNCHKWSWIQDSYIFIPFKQNERTLWNLNLDKK